MAFLRSQKPKTFHLFPRLPSELRRKIWTMSLQPRLIDIRLRALNREDGKAWPTPQLDCVLPAPYKSPLPSIFHVCQESRGEIISQYHPLIGISFHAAEGTLVNPELDTVYCPDELFNVEDQIMPKTAVGPDYYFPDRSVLFRLALDGTFAEQVTSLAISAKSLKAMGTMTENMIPVLKKYKNLRNLFLVGDVGSGGRREDWSWYGEPRLLPGRSCPDGECTFWLYMFAGLVPVDVMTWQSRPVEELQYAFMYIPDEDWRAPAFNFMECRRYVDWGLHQRDKCV